MKKVIPWSETGAVLATIFDQKSKKSPQGSPKGAKSREKMHLKNYAKIDSEKGTKSMPEGFQNDAKMHAKIILFNKKSMRNSMPKKS